MKKNKLISYQHALELLNTVAHKNTINTIEKITLSDSINQILAEDVLSPITVPSFNNSAMDGFAVQSILVNNALKKKDYVQLEVTGSIQAGDASDVLLDNKTHQAWEIMTGAPVPDIFDAVIPIENVEIIENSNSKSIKIFEELKVGRNIRKLGTDYQIKQQVVKKHTIIQSQHIMALATVGIREVDVIPKIRVAILSTGNELFNVKSEKLYSGKIYNSNQPYLKSYCENLNCNPVFTGMCKDNIDAFNKLIDYALLKDVKIVFSTGAVSMGKYDFIPQALIQRGAKIHFHKSKIKPGKPILFAELPDGTYYFGLPGNPIAAAAGMRFFVSPFIRTLLNLAPELNFKAKLLSSIEKKQGFRSFAKALACLDKHGQLCVEILFDQGSYQSRSFAQANCWIILGEKFEKIKKGEIINIAPMIPNQMIL